MNIFKWLTTDPEPEPWEVEELAEMHRTMREATESDAPWVAVSSDHVADLDLREWEPLPDAVAEALSRGEMVLYMRRSQA